MLHPRQLSCLTLPQLCLILADWEDAIPFWGEKAQKTWFEEGENKLSLCLLLLMVTGYRRFFSAPFYYVLLFMLLQLSHFFPHWPPPPSTTPSLRPSPRVVVCVHGSGTYVLWFGGNEPL